jgi:hypothetical protein
VRDPKNIMMTWPGLRFLDVFDPDPEEIVIEDIANSLGMLCRYNGHVPRFYSVAEHCVLMANYAFEVERSTMFSFAVLMDDAPEAYIGDMTRPMKQRLPEYRTIDDRFGEVIRRKFGIDSSMFHEDMLREYDSRMLRTEMDAMLGAGLVRDHFPQIAAKKPLPGVRLQHWAPEEATYQFMDAFHRFKPLW